MRPPGAFGAPDISRCPCGRRKAPRSWLDGILGGGVRALARRGPDGGGRTAQAPSRLCHSEGEDRFCGGNWSSPPISSSSRPPAACRTKSGQRASGLRNEDRHRRLPLVHRLGPRHDDQPRRADARHGTTERGRLHPADLRPLPARRADPQPVSRRATARASTTRPTPRSGSFTP